MEWRHSLYITYNEKQYIVDHVDPDRYSYLELVSDLYEWVLRDIPTNVTCIFTVRCRIPPTTQFMELKTDKDVLEMFNMYRGQVGIHLEVVNVEKAEALSQEKPNKPKSTAEVEAEAENEAQPQCCPVAGETEKEQQTCPAAAETEAQQQSCPAAAETQEFCDDWPDENEMLFTSSAEDDVDYVEEEGQTDVSISDDDDNAEWEEDEDLVEEDDLGSESEPEVHVGDVYSSASSSDEEEIRVIDPCKNIKGKRFQCDDNGKVKLEENQIFGDVDEFRQALKDYIIQENFDVIRKKNEKARVTVICAASGCPWRVHASPLPDGRTYMIKSYHEEHSCLKHAEKTAVDSTWMAKKLQDSLRADPYMSYDLMYNELNNKFGIQPHPMQLYRARRRALEEVEGKHTTSYKLLPAYGSLLKERNPGSVVKITYKMRTTLNPSPTFRRFFVCLNACKEGFLEGCRPFVGLDGCHLKGPFGGVLLVAVSLDGNNSLFPLAYMVAEKETKDSWRHFLHCLHAAIGPGKENKPFTFMSDRQRGLPDAVSCVFPAFLHRHCSAHLLKNFKAKHPLVVLRDYFWMAVTAPNQFMFGKAMEKMSVVSDEAHNYLMEIPTERWSRHAFDTRAKSPHITNNVCESFNKWILSLRDKPILTLLDGIRSKIMNSFYRKFSTCCNWEHNVGPRIVKHLNNILSDSGHCKVSAAGRHQFEVKDGHTRFVVNLVERICECNVWALSGLPCKHAAACIRANHLKIQDYCDEYYSKSMYLKAYANIVSPLPDLATLAEADVAPPMLARLPGRPRTRRFRGEAEAPPSTAAKRASTVKCSNCKELGHNIRGCQRAPVKQKGKVKKAATSCQPTAATPSSSQPTAATQEPSPRIPKTRSQSMTHENPTGGSTAQEIAMAQYKAKRAKRIAREEARKSQPVAHTSEHLSEGNTSGVQGTSQGL